MKPRSIVFNDEHGRHRAIVLAEVPPSKVLIVSSTSRYRDQLLYPHFAVEPRSQGWRSLGWDQHDNRTSYFYASAVQVKLVSDLIDPSTVPHHSRLSPRPRLVDNVLFQRLLSTVMGWVEGGVITDAAVRSALMPGSPPPVATSIEIPSSPPAVVNVSDSADIPRVE